MVDSPPTIYDVAKRAGVSIATASRALNSLASVRPATRAKVLAAMDELEFVPNMVARGLSSGKHWILGLVYMRSVDDGNVLGVEEASLLYTDIVIRGAESRAAELGYSLLLSSADENHPSGMSSLLRLTGSVDGLILLDRVISEQDVAFIARRIPVVLLAGKGDSESAITIRVDNEQAMRSLAEHLVGVHGYRRVGVVAGANESPDSAARVQALRDALNELGATLDENDVLDADWTSAGGEAAMRERLSRGGPLPQAFVCANDQMAIGVVYALNAGGFKVPDDVAVTGFDDIALTRYFSPPLTTIRQSGALLGEVAVDALVATFNGTEDVARTIVLPTELVVRASCGCSTDTSSAVARHEHSTMMSEVH
ncbi:MAG: LacI family transcriptional regulator [Acidobacteria bacterium]|nr:LacI family transcriptional regulator [Acidobacteriota bacterium]